MCQKCVKKSKNLGSPKTITRGQVTFFATQDQSFVYWKEKKTYLTFHNSIPLFWEKAANYAVLAEEYRMQQAKTDKSKYTRKGRHIKDYKQE